MKTVIEMAEEAGMWEGDHCEFVANSVKTLERFAELVRAEEAKRADALAATIMALRDIVTSDFESKSEFIARVCDVLGSCPDNRVLNAVAKEREACAMVCEKIAEGDPNDPNNEVAEYTIYGIAMECTAAIRARGQQ